MIKKIISKLWISLLTQLKKIIDNRILEDQDLYVVYYTNHVLNPRVFVTQNGIEALTLVQALERVQELTRDRSGGIIQYGKLDVVYTHKLPSLLDITFTWDASPSDREKIYNHIIEVPVELRNKKQ
jgi:hypothetical protein